MSKELKLGMPYMGSKRKLAKKIVDKILQDNPNCHYVYDLFGGGGAVSFEFLQRPQIKRVIYNEFNTGVVELLKDIKENGITEKYCQWIDRETFHKHKSDNDWFGGLCKVVWSFGNQQTTYLFGKDIESIKKTAHEYLLKNGYKIGEKEKRIKLVKQFKNDEQVKRRFELQQLEQLQRLESLQQLQRLERLQQLEQLEQLERLEIQNKSFEDVIIETPIEETIIYLDPPYLGTVKYEKDIDQQLLNDYINSSPYKIYLSSYDSGLRVAEEYKHNSPFSQDKNNSVIERLFFKELNDGYDYLKNKLKCPYCSGKVKGRYCEDCLEEINKLK